MERVVVSSEEDIKRIIREVIREELSGLIGMGAKAMQVEHEILLTRAEMAAYLRISLVTLTDWVKRGLPAHRKRKGGRVLFQKSEVLRWLRSNRARDRTPIRE
jgi:excisionase family DNA binding protein